MLNLENGFKKKNEHAQNNAHDAKQLSSGKQNTVQIADISSSVTQPISARHEDVTFAHVQHSSGQVHTEEKPTKDQKQPNPGSDDPMAGQCRQFKADGSRCRANAQRSSEFCFFHDPATADERDAARVHGGQERSRKAAVLPGDTPDRKLTSAADVTALLAETINQVRRGEIDAYIANSVGQLSQTLLKARQHDEFEQRLAKVESIFPSKWVHPKSAVKPIIESDAFEFSEPQSGGQA